MGEAVKRIGVIGGGQLAWMMAAGAETLGLELAIQTPKATDPAVAIAHHTVFGAVDDAQTTAKLAEVCDVITFENEFIDLAALSELAKRGVCFYPRLSSLAPLLDKYDQRRYLQELGLPVPRFISLTIQPDSEPDWSALENFSPLPVVLKTRRLGYDGQGTVIARTPEAIAQIWQQWAGREILVEEFVPFERELAVIAARSASGEFSTYPVVETQQEQQVCRRVLAVGDLPTAVVEQVQAIAQTLLEALDYVGVMGIEFFLTAEGMVLVNETAPRTHNSGHFTLDACAVSQFEQQLRAVSGAELGNPGLTCAGAVMVNLLGYETATSDYQEKRQQLSALANSQVYWYGKAESRPGRKLGHVTVTLADQPESLRDQAVAIAHQIETIWYPLS